MALKPVTIITALITLIVWFTGAQTVGAEDNRHRPLVSQNTPGFVKTNLPQPRPPRPVPALYRAEFLCITPGVDTAHDQKEIQTPHLIQNTKSPASRKIMRSTRTKQLPAKDCDRSPESREAEMGKT